MLQPTASTLRTALSTLKWIILGILKWITFATVGLVGLAVVLITYDISSGPSYDDDDPRYQKLTSRFSELRHREPGPGIDYNIDLSGLNGGDWTIACIFGGYNDPLESMIELGAKVTDKDRTRLTEAGDSGFRLSQVEEFEMMVTFIDLTGKAQFIHFQGGIGPGGQHLKKCISKPQTVIDLRDA
jgi:hypothetical protein